MIVILAGSGASRAVSEDYPTTIEFVDRLPASMKATGNSLYARVYQALQAEKGGEKVDVEELLGRMMQLRRAAEVVGQIDVFAKTFGENRGVPNAEGEWIGRLLSLQGVQPFRVHADRIADRLRERLWEHYSILPSAKDLNRTWMPLLEGLLASDHDVEIYTLNYDRVLDTALDSLPEETVRSSRVERGVYPRAGAHRVVPATWTKSEDELRKGKANYVLLTKLHGSLNWVRENDEIVQGAWTQPPRDLAAAGIVYPELDKDASSVEPFRIFYDRFSASVRQAALVLSVGYAHRDPAIEVRLASSRAAPLVVLNPQDGLAARLEDEGQPLVSQIVDGLSPASALAALGYLS